MKGGIVCSGNLTLKDLSLSVTTYDVRSLQYDTSVHGSNPKIVKRKKQSPVRIEIVT